MGYIQDIPTLDSNKTYPVRHMGKVVGMIKKGIYTKVCTKEHFMVKFNGFGISYEILKKLKLLGIDCVEITYNGVKGVKKYESKIGDWLTTSKTHNFNGDSQSFLSLGEMNERNS